MAATAPAERASSPKALCSLMVLTLAAALNALTELWDCGTTGCEAVGLMRRAAEAMEEFQQVHDELEQEDWLSNPELSSQREIISLIHKEMGLLMNGDLGEQLRMDMRFSEITDQLKIDTQFKKIVEQEEGRRQ